MFFGRTELIIGASKAKNCEESASDVRFHVAPPKPAKKSEKRNFQIEFFRRKEFVFRRKMKRRGSSETRVGKV